MQTMDFKQLLTRLPARQHEAHKGNFGHVLVIGGDFGYAGAPVLAALGALRVGAGLVTVASHHDNLLGLNAHYPEIMTLAIDSITKLKDALKKATVIVLGPGLGRSSWSKKVFYTASKTKLPQIIDADALFFLAKKPHKNALRILTPHPGEAATLLHQKNSVTERETALQQIISKYDSTVVLKGAGTLVGSKNSIVEICNAGNPGMATAGMGDLLSGIIAGLVAQGLELDLAAKLGACAHAMAGDIAAKSGERGIIATDLLLPLKLLMG